MVKFVRLPLQDGAWIPVNPDLVAYVRRRGDQTAIVFGAVQGGLHELLVDGDGDQVVQLLEGAAPAAREIEPVEDSERVAFDDGWAPHAAALDVVRPTPAGLIQPAAKAAPAPPKRRR